MPMPQVDGSAEPVSREDATGPAPDNAFDLIVIGAGINGAGIARDAAARGLRVALVEKEDIGSGTSSWSGRLIHGGLRYLEHGDIRLVRESLRERELLFRLAPHLVKPVPLMMPFYSHNRRSRWTIRAGMVAYDLLSWDKSTTTHRVLTREGTIARFPGMADSGLEGSAIFVDGQVVWSERLCVEVALAARADGAVIYTHSEVDGLIKADGRVHGVRYTDVLTGNRHALQARIVVNAAGPWIDYVLAEGEAADRRYIGGAKGSHLIVDPFPGAPGDVVYYESQTDGRLIFVIPWGERYLIGTTDRRYDDNPDYVRADEAEVSYLLSETNQLIPEANLTTKDVLYTYSGVRPLPFVPDQSEWKVPRSHVIHDHAPEQRGLLSIIGGKLTTYRSLAEETVDTVYAQLGLKKPRCPTARLLFPGARVGDWSAYRRSVEQMGNLPVPVIERLIAIYGSRAADLIALGRNDPNLLESFDDQTGAIGAELVFTWLHEFARSLTDVLVRRTMVGLNADCGRNAVDRAASILATYLGWDASRVTREIDDYHRYIERLAVPENAGSKRAVTTTRRSA